MRTYSDQYSKRLIMRPTVEEVSKVFSSYEPMLLSIWQYIITTFAEEPDYPFFNTKIDTISGENLHHFVGEIDLFGKETIYGWIQGRGLESIAKHYLWVSKVKILDEAEKKYFRDYSLSLLREVSYKLNSFRKKNNSRLFFWMDQSGNAFRLNENNKKEILSLNPDESGYSDLFSVKGLIISSFLLKDEELESEAKIYYDSIIDCLKNDRFQTDQQQFDPKNNVIFDSNKISYGPKMIGLGICTLFYELYREKKYVDDGFFLIHEILSKFANYDNKFPSFHKYDIPEFVDHEGKPFSENGQVLSYPGHAIELCGFIGDFFHTIERGNIVSKDQKKYINWVYSILPDFFTHNFRLGIKPGYGIYKSVSLETCNAMNSDMPWWALPETLKAAAHIYTIAPEKQKTEILSIIAEASNTFLSRYINPGVHCMAYQTLDESGNPIRAIPATPDADVGYHTGLSIINFMNVWAEVNGQDLESIT